MHHRRSLQQRPWRRLLLNPQHAHTPAPPTGFSGSAASRFSWSLAPTHPYRTTGFSGVALAAYGAHALKPADPHFSTVWQRANSQQMYHTLLIAAAPLAK